MIAVKINNIKDFMTKLLVKDTFDNLYVSEATISTYNTFQINGLINKNFYTSEEPESNDSAEYSLWKKLRPFCFELIKGSKTPSFLKIIFLLATKDITTLIETNNLGFSLDDINGLVLNIKYAEGVITCITGSSIKLFTMDKSLEHAFDSYAKQFLSQNNIDFEEL